MTFNFDREKVRSKTPFFGKIDDIPWKWEDALKFLDSHPEDEIDYHAEKCRFFLTGSQRRRSAPKFAKLIHAEMKEFFYKNKCSNIIFFGFGPQNLSYPWHTDKMDVFLVQVVGDVQIRVENTEWENELRDFKVGDCVFIPRGTHHEIVTGKSRVTFSFGVEKQPDPSTYI